MGPGFWSWGKDLLMERSSIAEYLPLKPALRDRVGVCVFVLEASFSPSFMCQVVCSNKIALGIHTVRRKMQIPTVTNALLR